jgi:hypothetical protein
VDRVTACAASVSGICRQLSMVSSLSKNLAAW